MGLEIERKFLIKNETWKSLAHKITEIKQGYLSTVPERTVRIRIKDEQGVLTIKGKNKGMTRLEFEYSIPYAEAIDLLALCEQPIIAKKRYLIQVEELLWEVDIFEGANQGLEVAEVELTSEDQKITWPAWIGKEVTEDPKYYNSSLIKFPFSAWEKEED